MKKIIPLFFSIAFSIVSTGQSVAYHFPEEFYFVKEIPASVWQGKNFRYEIAVKSDPFDSLSKVRIHAVAVGKGEDDFIKSHFGIETRQEQDWTIYTVIGRVDDAAQKLWFYAAVNGNGDFYFDDISFYVEDRPDHWLQLRISNPSFEESKPDIFNGYYVSKRNSSTTQTSISKEIYKTGRQSLQVSSRRQVTANAVTVSME